MTENNKDNNKNIFVQFFEWCKRTFLHPTTVFATLLIIVISLLFINLYKISYGHFITGPNLIYWKNQDCSLHRLNTGEILILGSNSHKTFKNSNMLYYVESELFNPQTNKFLPVNIDYKLFYLSSAIILNNGNILLTEVYPNRMAILNPKTFKVEKLINLFADRHCGKYILELSNNKICVFGKNSNKNKDFLEIYDLNTGLLIDSFVIPQIYSGNIYWKPAYKLVDDNIFVLGSSNKNILINIKNKSYEEIPNPWQKQPACSVQINDSDILIFSEYSYGIGKTIITKFSIKNKSYEKVGIYKLRMNWHETDATFTKVNQNNILICGGYKFLDPFKIFKMKSDDAYLFNIKSKKLHKISQMKYPVAQHKSILLDDGRVFIVGDDDYSFETQFFEINKRRK